MRYTYRTSLLVEVDAHDEDEAYEKAESIVDLKEVEIESIDLVGTPKEYDNDDAEYERWRERNV